MVWFLTRTRVFLLGLLALAAMWWKTRRLQNRRVLKTAGSSDSATVSAAAYSSAGAAHFEAAQAHARGLRLSTEKQLQLYGLFKQAREGTCTGEAPSALNMAARAKWEAWTALGALPRAEAMAAYARLVTSLSPDWEASSTSEDGGVQHQAQPQEQQGGGLSMAPKASTIVVDETTEEWRKGNDVFYLASTEDTEGMIRALRVPGADLNAQDAEGRGVLHWACDRNHKGMVEALLSLRSGAAKLNLELRDAEGLTPLAYAACCDHEDIALLLVRAGAAVDAEDSTGERAISMASKKLAEKMRAAAKT